MGDIDKSVENSEWIKPDEVMKLHQAKRRKKLALQARMNKTMPSDNKSPSLNIFMNQLSSQQSPVPSQKRKNPFTKDESNKKTKETDKINPELEASTDSVFFDLLNNKPPIKQPENIELSFKSILQNSNNIIEKVETFPKGISYVPLDWTLNTKMRLMSTKPFCWNGKLKTSEQASGTTGFVRCLNTGEQDTTLDTSPNARFHQCCLVWQHPSLPWLELFPRSAGKVSANLASNSAISNNQFIKESLFSEWSDSFRSLFHLLRARQCPYFYVCANNFTVLFRAAGICGVSEVHAFLTPTTRGFRQSLKQEDIEFTMPLKPNSKRLSDITDSGCETFDSTNSNVTSPDKIKGESLKQDDDDDDEEDEDGDDLLESLGFDDKQIKNIRHHQSRIVLEKESEVDRLKQSLVFIKGVEAQALFNFLINCKSAVAVTGALAGIPPTLLAPVAFHGATLKSLKVRENIIRIDKDKFHSLEIKGPILPHVLPSLCHLMKSSHLEEFSASCAHLSTTTSFSIAKHNLESSAENNDVEKVPKSVFGQENLSDCGFTPELLSHFCNPDPSRIQIVETLKYSNEEYTFS